MNKLIKTKELYQCQVEYLEDWFEQYEYPWQMLPEISTKIESLLRSGISGFSELKAGVLVGKNVKISEYVTIEAPAIIGHGTEIRPGAFIRGNIITGSDCVLGNSSEFKNCILLDKVQAPHYNYVGDSVLGNRVHMGAATVCSNLKTDGKAVVIHADESVNTGIRKIGAILADDVDIGCGCVINPGTVIGKNTWVYPLTALRGVYSENCIVKSQKDVVLKI